MTTPITPIRLPLDIKAIANKRATEEGTNLTQIIIKALTLYLLDDILDSRRDKGY